MSLTLLATPDLANLADDAITLHDVVHHWHHKALDFVQNDLPEILLILFIAFVLTRIVSFFIHRMKRLADSQLIDNPRRASELRTMAAILRATAYGVIGFIVLLHVLGALGINLTPLLASAGVVGVGIGLGAQSLFKDMLNGIFILIENQYNVGDNVKIAGHSGVVEDLTLRLTTVRDADGTLYSIPNSQVASVANYSRDFSVATLTLSVDATADPERVLALLRETALAVRNDPAFADIALAAPTIPGIDAINGRVVSYPISIRVAINQKDAILRELRRRILAAFEANDIPLGTDPNNILHLRELQAPSSKFTAQS
jgi:small conductance mechanosensitive channel